MILSAFWQFLYSNFLSFGVKTLEFLEFQMHSINAGLIESSMGKFSLECIPKLTNLRQNIRSADENLVQQRGVIFGINIETEKAGIGQGGLQFMKNLSIFSS